MTGWLHNDSLFRAELARGHCWEAWVCGFLRLRGLPADVPEQRCRPDVTERADYRDGGDLVCGGHTIEVKARRVAFTSPLDFPHREVIVDTANKWKAKNPRPSALICVSELTGAMICIGPHEISQSEQWRTVERFDRVRKIHDQFLMLHREKWRPVSALVAWLNSDQGVAI